MNDDQHSVMAGGPIAADLARAIASAQAHREGLLALPRVVSVRGGYKFVDGRITSTAAVVVSVERKLERVPRAQRVPAVLDDGVPTDVRTASPIERLAQVAAVQPGVAAALDAVAAAAFLIDEVQAPPADGPAVEFVPVITYQPPAGANLDPVTGAMTIRCHVAPEASWRVLRPFLAATQNELVLGMYDFTAPHIYRTARSVLLGSQVTWRQTLGPRESLPAPGDVDSNKAEDLHEADIVTGLGTAAPNRFESVFADVGNGRTFASAYHIKVAVRDRKAVWLSSGNWQSSNVPAIDFYGDDADRRLLARYNREWNVVIEHPPLARKFRRYLEGDFETASNAAPADAIDVALPDLLLESDPALAAETAAVELKAFRSREFVFDSNDPLTIQPILTPDNYLQVVVDLLRQRPNKRLYFQNQSLNPGKTPSAAWAELVQLLAGYSRDPALDVRIIIRNIGDIRKTLESIKVAGFDMNRVKVQVDCHTKGIVIDSSTVLLGSHNWTDQGVQVNRDASLLIRRPEIARYYERVFLHDWERLARFKINENAMPVPVPAPGGVGPADAVEAAPGARRIPWSQWLPE